MKRTAPVAQMNFKELPVGILNHRGAKCNSSFTTLPDKEEKGTVNPLGEMLSHSSSLSWDFWDAKDLQKKLGS